MDIQICIGSACHLKGSYEVIEKFKKLVKDHPENEIELKSSFCLGQCSDAVSVKVLDTVYSVSPETAEHFFKSVILEEE